MAISPGMLFRKIVGVLFLIVAGALLGGAVLVTGFDGSGLQALLRRVLTCSER